MLQKPSSVFFFIIQNVGGMAANPGKFFFLHCIYVVFVCFGLFLFLVATAMFIIGETDFKSKLSTTQFFVSTIHITLKQFNILSRGRFVKKILYEIDISWEQLKTGYSELEIFEKTESNIWKYLYTSLAVFLLPVPVVILELIKFNWNREPEEWIQPLPVWMPFPQNWYVANCLFQLYGFFCGLLSLAVSSVIVVFLSQYIVLHMKVLQYILQNRSIRNTRFFIYTLHQNIIRYVYYMNDLLSGQIFLEMVINSFEAAAGIYGVIEAISKGETSFAQCLLSMLAVVTPFVICKCGNYITEQNELVHNAAYQNLWYEEDVQSRKELVILMSMATKPSYFHYKHLLRFGMEQFTSFCQAVYSYIMMLRFIANHDI